MYVSLCAVCACVCCVYVCYVCVCMCCMLRMHIMYINGDLCSFVTMAYVFIASPSAGRSTKTDSTNNMTEMTTSVVRNDQVSSEMTKRRQR